MSAASLPPGLQLESLEVGAAPVVRRFLARLDLPGFFTRHLPPLPGRPPALPSATVLGVLVTNLLLARQPLYALADWTARLVPEHIGLEPDQVALLNDDRLGRALDHLDRADRASLLTALIKHVVGEFAIDLAELHQDTTTVTFSGAYAHQTPTTQAERPHITFGYNKDHRPDLKQLLFSITISADGAVPVHCKVYDGNTPDDAVHIETWNFLRQLVGHAAFLYVADSKLCSRENMHHIASRHGRFLTVMPRTRSEDAWFRQHLATNAVAWEEVHREKNPRGREKPDIVYQAVQSPQLSSDGYRILWYRSSQKVQQDAESRRVRRERAYARWDAVRASRRGQFATAEQALEVGQRIITDEQVQDWIRVEAEVVRETDYQQVGPGRPGPHTEYRRVERVWYRPRLVEDEPALKRAALSDGLFPLLTNDETLSLAEALGKYKYQPFVEKRHEQLKSGFAVTPMWLQSVRRVASMLWLYYVVELVQALLEREVRRQMRQRGEESLALYPEGRASEAPTAVLVLGILAGHRRHRLLSQAGQELQRFHDPVPEDAQRVLAWLGVDGAAYGLP